MRRVEIPKRSGGERRLGIPTVLDRFIQQAVLQVLQRHWDRTFSEHSYGFRPGRSSHQAVAEAQRYVCEGRRWVVDIDLEKFFDRVNHDRLMGRLAQRVRDRALLKLKVNGLKSAVDRPWKRKFLGFSFTGGREPRVRIAQAALIRFKERVRELTRRTRAVGLERMVKELSAYLKGWHGYYGYCQTPSVLRDLDSWIRRRLRSVVWKQWKWGRSRYAGLRARGVSKELAAQTAGSSHGPWRISRSPALSYALPSAFFAALGLPRLAP